MIWFTSDTHYNHRNIVRGISQWGKEGDIHNIERTRNFKTLEEHNDKLVENINKVVKAKDTLYFLGDWSFQGKESIWEFRKKLNVMKIHLYYGNHDIHIEKNTIIPNLLINVQTKEFFNGTADIYNTTNTAIREARTQDLFESTQHYGNRSIEGQEIIMSHYSFRTWDRASKGTWMLYGHSHGTLGDYGTGREIHLRDENGGIIPGTAPELYKTMDVGIDTHPEFRPYSFEEIKKIMENRVNLTVDHHKNKNHTWY